MRMARVLGLCEVGGVVAVFMRRMWAIYGGYCAEMRILGVVNVTLCGVVRG